MTPNMIDDTKISRELLKKYDVAGPRYTSYPTAPVWTTDFTAKDYRDAINRGQSKRTDKPMSLYFHLPFCDSLCYFCGCSVIISRDRGKTADYIDLLATEMALVGPLYSKKRKVVQLHFGGGSPSNLTPPQNRLLFSHINKWFDVDYSEGEISVEIDPRHASNDYLSSIRDLGVNRISMGVQDFDPKVQAAVNRIQPVALTEGVFNECRKLNFNGINIDLIYGLPFQTVEGFGQTLDQVIRMSPDRIAVFNYAHVPWLKKHMVLIKEQDLPSPEVKFALMSMILDRLTGAGYVVIGMDHFAKPDDELTLAQKEYSLYRNFQGYTTKAEADLVGMGVTAISMVGDVYSQNLKSLPDYQKSVMAGEIPVHRGYRLSLDDEMRRQVITRVMCDLEINRQNILNSFGKNFDQYFKKEIEDLDRFQQDGLLTITPEKITLTATGRIFMRNIAMTFDRYLNVTSKGPLFSRTL